MTKKFDEQQRILAALNAVHAERLTQRAQLRVEVERAYEAKLYNLKLEEAKLMIEGYDLGVSKSKLGRAIGTTDWKTIQGMLDLGREMLPTPIEFVEPYTWSERFTMPNGYNYWFLVVDGDDRVSTIANAQGGITHEHDGYVYVDFGAQGYSWPLGKPSPEAQVWAAQNAPSE